MATKPAATSQHSLPADSGAEVAIAEGFLVDDGAGGFALAASGPADALLISDGAGGLAIAASGTVAGRLYRYGTNYQPRLT